MTVFVHSWFRSGSTWLWSKFRDDSRYIAFYEPLNEELPLWTPQRLDRTPARAFEGDSHPELDRHYFYEYRDLIASEKLGFEKSLSYERYFLNDDETDAALRSYLDRLISSAENAGSVAALCFCRSQMRANWMRKNFGGIHIAQIRNPWNQWLSFGKHQYFRNTVLLTAYCLEKHRPGSFSHISGFSDLFAAWNTGHTARIGEIGCFTAYAVLWIASAVQAIAASDIVIDMDLLGSGKAVSDRISDELRERGLPDELSDYQMPGDPTKLQIPQEYCRAMDNAVASLRDSNAARLLPLNRQVAVERLDRLAGHSADILHRALP